ncbi:PAS domain-containing protein [Aestuariivita sp.]|jgi:PAS domain S-box-containing protein|uniref:PAS domain-containing protein n=1 Tax=Aestuariivita sp. TaxID=1872407 RepID=UPI0021749D11|nr:PAS domain-containing protein [Aestuariivita sp.]MCE8005872.1 PAS domain-containing protein [Aestuariivita sp.]
MPDSVAQLLDEDRALEGFSRADVSMILTNPNLEDNPIIYVNEAFQRMTGYARSATIGRNCRFLQGKDTDIADVDRLRDAIGRETDVTVDILNYRANGEPFLNRLIVAPVKDARGHCQYFVGIQKEIRESDIDATAERIGRQMVEVQNRVKADLSMVIDMIRRQSRETTAPEDFIALSRRIETLQLLYEEMKLSDSRSNADTVELGSFLSRIACAIAHVDGSPGIRMSLQIEPLSVPVEVATRVGLVMSEVLSNAYQHAFMRLDTGLVEVRMSRLSEGGLRLIVADDGVGIPKSVSWPNGNSVGGRVLTGLIEGLEGTLQLGRGAAGSVVTIDVPAGASEMNT